MLTCGKNHHNIVIILQLSKYFFKVFLERAFSPKILFTKKVKVKSLSHVRLFVTSWTAAHQAPLSMGFSRQGYWSGLPFPSPGDLPDPGFKPGCPILQADVLLSEPPRKPKEADLNLIFKVSSFQAFYKTDQTVFDFFCLSYCFT